MWRFSTTFRHFDALEECELEAADKLYWDEKSGALKKGAQGKAAGTPRRLVRFMRQLRRTYDPPAMTADQLVCVLPREFERWKQSLRPSAKAVVQDDRTIWYDAF